MTYPKPWVYLRRERRRAGLSQTGLARELGTTSQHVCRVESGLRAFSPELMARLATILSVHVDVLYETAPDPPTQVIPTSRLAS